MSVYGRCQLGEVSLYFFFLEMVNQPSQALIILPMSTIFSRSSKSPAAEKTSLSKTRVCMYYIFFFLLIINVKLHTDNVAISLSSKL